MIEKAFGFGVDAVMLDIEDGVATGEKQTARREIANVLDQVATRIAAGETMRAPARFVRINALTASVLHEDTTAAVRPALEGLVLSKVESVKEIETVDKMVRERESATKMPVGSVQLLVGIETPKGLLNAFPIASASPRVCGLIFGAEDFGRELGLPLRRDGEARDLLYARSGIATAAAAAHVQAVDGIWPALQDSEGLAHFALQSRRLGFSGMSVLHPSQIDAVNAAFTPTAEEIEYARQVLEAFAGAQGRGKGVMALSGQFLDSPIVERARQITALAESIAARTAGH